jgi:hypothetical protein
MYDPVLGLLTFESKAVAELEVGQRVQVTREAGDKVMVKLSRGLGCELCLCDQRVLMAHRLEGRERDNQALIDYVDYAVRSLDKPRWDKAG